MRVDLALEIADDFLPEFYEAGLAIEALSELHGVERGPSWYVGHFEIQAARKFEMSLRLVFLLLEERIADEAGIEGRKTLNPYHQHLGLVPALEIGVPHRGLYPGRRLDGAKVCGEGECVVLLGRQGHWQSLGRARHCLADEI